MLSQLSSNEERQLRNKTFLSELYNFPAGIMPVGRLDEKSEGLLLLTTDGKLSDILNRSGIEKEYYVQLDGEITNMAIETLTKGVEIGFKGIRYTTKPCAVKKLDEAPTLSEPDKRIRLARHRPNSWVCITITEGKFRQVRKMTAAVGFPTLRLVRVRIGKLLLGNMPEGEVQQIETLVP
jgi:23S rRNA pseudouridine2457 synthase